MVKNNDFFDKILKESKNDIFKMSIAKSRRC